MFRVLFLIIAVSAQDPLDKDGESSRKILGSSVVTSVSVIMDAGNGSKIYADAAGQPVSKPHSPSEIASPIELLSPDRYEFYTFDDTGDLVKRLMTLEEIHDIIATGDDDGFTLDDLTANGFVPEKRVNDVVNNVQNVLKEEIKMHKNPEKPQFDTPDVSDSWSMILPAVFGNSGDDIKPEPAVHVTPDTVMIEPTVKVAATTEQISTNEKIMTLQTKTTAKSTTTTTEKNPVINVEIITNSNSTTEGVNVASGDPQLIEIKPYHDLEQTKEAATKPYYHVSKSTKRPFPIKVTTYKPSRTTATTTTVNSDAVAQAATVLMERVALLNASNAASTTPEPSTKVTLETTTSVTTEPSTLYRTTTQFADFVTTTEDFKSSTVLEKSATTTTILPETTSTFGPFSTFFAVNDNSKFASEGNNDDLSALSTQYVTAKADSDKTTEAPIVERTASTALDHLLLSSTNIYEINFEFSDLQQTTDSVESTANTQEMPTERLYVRLTNPTETPPPPTTTDRTFVDVIEQLISQAVGTAAPPIETEKEAAYIQEMMTNNTNKTMPEVMAEAATIASNLIGLRESTTVATTTLDDLDLLSDSVESLLSQVYGQGSTIVENNTTDATTEIATSTEAPSTTTFEPHIINITVIRNENVAQPKPAKSDLSLEKEFETVMTETKNSSIDDGLLKVDDTSPVQEQSTTEPLTVATTELTPSTTVYSSAAPIVNNNEDKPSVVITIAETKKDSDNTTWTLVSTVAPHGEIKQEPATEESPTHQIASILDPPPPVDLIPKPLQGFGLEDSTAKLDTDVYQFVQLCNELAFGLWKSTTSTISPSRSVVVSPFAATSLLAMVFLGARGATSGEMNEILRLDDMVTFNPHLIFKNVSESIEVNPDAGIAVAVIIRELYSDRMKGKLLGFYKERVRQFYEGHVEEAGFREIGDIIRRRTNLLVKKNTNGKISEFFKNGNIAPKPPLAGISVSILQTDCSQGSTEGRDGELHFIILPSLRQRRLIPIPAVTYRHGFLAGYEPSLDATAAALGTKEQIISTIFVIPGQQGTVTPGDGLARLEKRLVESAFKKGAWSRLLRSLIPRPGVELQIPRFLHRSVINATQSLKRMGLHELFDAQKADLKGLNGAAHELHLSDVIQVNEFATCGERKNADAYHMEVYPDSAERSTRLLNDEEWEEPVDYQRAFHDPLHDPTYFNLPLALRPRQARLPDAPRLRFDRPFLYFVRHNPTGLILHMGRFHPKLMP